MKGAIKLLAILAGVLGMSQASAAGQFTVSGSLDYFEDAAAGTRVKNGTFEVIIHYDDSGTPTTSGGFFGNSARWDDSVPRMTIRIFDGSRLAASRDIVYDPAVSSGYGATVSQTSSNGQRVEWRIATQDSMGSMDSSKVAFSDSASQLFIALSQYPNPEDMSGHEGTFTMDSTFNDGEPHQYQGAGVIEDISFDIADSDGDGLADDADNCPDSNLDTTVVVNGTDSGIPNTLQLDGCTLADLLGEDASPAEISRVTNALKKDGVLSGRDKGRLQSLSGKSR